MLKHSGERRNAPTAPQVVMATVSATIALAALAGWAFNIDTLTQIVPGSIAMNPATCVAVIAVSVGLVCRSQRLAPMIWVSAAVAITIGATKFIQSLFGTSVGVDQLLFADQLGRVADAPPSRMAPNVAFALAVLGLGLLWSVSRNPRKIAASQILCVVAAAIASVAAVGYVLDVVALYQIHNFIAMSLPTTIVIILLSFAVISINPKVGIARISSDRGPAGLLTRFALPFAILVPLTIGVAVLAGQHAGWYGADFATSLSLMANVVVNILLLGCCIVMLFQSDRERKSREASIAQSESEYREAEKVGHIGYWKVDTSNGVVQWSDGFQKICGLSPATLPSVEAIIGVCHPEDAPIARAFIEQFDSGDWEFACRIQRPNGEIRHVRSHGVRLASDRGPATTILGVFSDITELELARQAAEKAKKTTASFLANMSHEIRTPMNGVMGFVELLLRGDLNETQRRHLGLVQDSAQALLKLLNDILDISKIESGQLEISPSAYDVRHGIVQCVRLMTPIAEQKGISLHLSISDDLPQELNLDGLRMRQVLLNLIGNAVKFTNEGCVKVAAGKASGRGGAQLLQISVEDTGIGIPPDRLECVFETFVQAEGSTAQWFGGSGLGLSISRSLAEMMGGAIRVESIVGEGTTMTLVLPWVELEGEIPDVAGGAAVDGVVEGDSRGGASILLVEDVDINRELFSEMLTQLGHRHDLAENGAKGCELAQRLADDPLAWDLILMDLQMPVMDGLTATKTIRGYGGRAAEIPIIALTASAFEEEIQECLGAGMDDHLAKPVTITALRDIIDRWFDRAEPVLCKNEELPASLAMRAKFADRCEATHHRLTEILVELSSRNPQHCVEHVAEAREAAHFLAGCAGMFGQPGLGDFASNVERKLEAAAAQLPARVAIARRAVQALVGQLESAGSCSNRLPDTPDKRSRIANGRTAL